MNEKYLIGSLFGFLVVGIAIAQLIVRIPIAQKSAPVPKIDSAESASPKPSSRESGNASHDENRGPREERGSTSGEPESGKR